MAINRRVFLRNAAGLAAASGAAAAACGLFGGGTASSSPMIRPPGALPEEQFLATCIRCMRCVDACPNHAIQSLPPSDGQPAAGTPIIKPRQQACMLCSRIETDYLCCTAACPTGALRPVRKTLEAVSRQVHMGVARIDLNLCYSYNNYTCGTCYHACPVGAIKIGLWERPQVIEDACVGCGLCERACIRYPQAIRVQPVDRSAAMSSAAAAKQQEQSG